MTFPTVAGTPTSGIVTTNSTSWTLTYPSGIQAGELLIGIIGRDGGTADTFGWPTGWSVITNKVGGSACLNVARKFADGTESGNFTVDVVASEQGAWRVFRVSGAHLSEEPAVGTASSGVTQNPDPPTATAGWGSADNLFITCYGADHGGNSVATAYPTNYSDNQATAGSGGTAGAGYGVATRELAAATDNPGTFTMTASDGWDAQTIVIRPAAPLHQGTGTPSLPLLTASGSGRAYKAGSGAANLPLLTASGAGKQIKKGTGAANLPLPTASGSGVVTTQGVTHYGTGTPNLPILTAAGAGKRTLRATGSPSLPVPTAAGQGKQAKFATGAPALPILTATGQGKQIKKGSGAANLPLVTGSGTGRRTLRSTGSPSLPILTSAGTGKLPTRGTGAPSLPKLTAAGVGRRTLRGTGTPNLPLLAALGVGRKLHQGSGAAQLPLLIAEGVAAKIVPPSETGRRMWRHTFA